MSLHASVTAHAAGYDENMFPGSGNQNLCGGRPAAPTSCLSPGDGEVVTPKSDSFCPPSPGAPWSMWQEHYLGLKVTQRPVKLAELKVSWSAACTAPRQ